jgi:hypothetical protein
MSPSQRNRRAPLIGKLHSRIGELREREKVLWPDSVQSKATNILGMSIINASA